jgi:hypothetical protein
MLVGNHGLVVTLPFGSGCKFCIFICSVFWAKMFKWAEDMRCMKEFTGGPTEDMLFGYYGASVLQEVKTDPNTEHQSFSKQKPKPNRKTDNSDRIGFRSSVKKCPPLCPPPSSSSTWRGTWWAQWRWGNRGAVAAFYAAATAYARRGLHHGTPPRTASRR